MVIQTIINNPYRILGVLSNTSLKERVGNQNRLAAFAKVGKEIAFPNDFATILTEKPVRTTESIAVANTSINLDKDRLKYALFWFISSSLMDDIALKHLQAGNIDKATEIFQKKENFASLINSGVLAFVKDDVATGFSNISKVIHEQNYRLGLLQVLGMDNLIIAEDELLSLFIEELIKDVPAKSLLTATKSKNDREIISKIALEGPIAAINSAISIAKKIDSHNAKANLTAGRKLMSSTKKLLKEVRDIAGASSPKYQIVADNLAKQILQCGINYYNNASDDDADSPRKAMELQKYALKIAVGQLTKDRCRENVDILVKVIDELPPLIIEKDVTLILELLNIIVDVRHKNDFDDILDNSDSPYLSAVWMHGVSNIYESGLTCIGYKEDSYTPTEFYNKRNILVRISLYLGKIRDIVGSDNKFFIELCNKIVRDCLNAAIEYANSEVPKYNSFCKKIKSCLDICINNSLCPSSYKQRYMSEYDRKSREFQHYMINVFDYIFGLSEFPIDSTVKEWYDNNLKRISDLISDFRNYHNYSRAIQIMSESEFYNSCESEAYYLLYQEVYPGGKYYDDAKTQIKYIQERKLLEEKKRQEDQILEDKRKRIQSLKTLDACIGFKNSNSLNAELKKILDDRAYSICVSKDDYKLYLLNFSRHKSEAKNQLTKKMFISVFWIIFIIILLILMISFSY